MPGINPLSYQPSLNNQFILIRPELLFSRKQSRVYPEDSFTFLNNYANSFKPFGFVSSSKPEQSILGTVNSLWNEIKNKAENLWNSFWGNTVTPGFIPVNKQIVETSYRDINGKPVKLNQEAAYYFNNLIDIAGRKGIDVRVDSSYRTVAEQKVLWNQALKKYKNQSTASMWVAPPGKSQHNIGNAIDLSMYKNGRQVSQSEFDKVISEAGFYRPMSWETWHIEPISTVNLRNIG